MTRPPQGQEKTMADCVSLAGFRAVPVTSYFFRQVSHSPGRLNSIVTPDGAEKSNPTETGL
jgi:hypothetical protein